MKLSFVRSLALMLAFFGGLEAAAQAPSSLQYPTPNGFIANVSNVYLSPTLAGSNSAANPVSYAITPALPTGLALNAATGVISGMPTVAKVSTNYTVTATNSFGSTNGVFNITVTNPFLNNANDSLFFLTTDTLRKVGTGTNAGDVILYQNVRTISGQAIDCIVKTVSFTTGTTFSSYDQPLATDNNTFNSNNPRFFSPQVTFPTGGGNVVFEFQFIAHGTYNNATGTGLSVTLQNVQLNTYDIDGNGNANSNQYNEFEGFDTSEVSSATTLKAPVYDAATGLSKFESNIATNNPTVTADATRVRLTYRNMSTFRIQVGAGSNGAAYFFLDFSSGPTFLTAVKSTPPALDLNTTLYGVDNGGNGCASSFSFTGASQTNIASGTALTELSIAYNNTASNIPNGASEQLSISGSTAGTGTHALNFTTGSTSSVTVGGVSYTITKSVSGTTNTIAFTNGSTFTTANAEALLDALSYNNIASVPTQGSRTFTLSVRTTQYSSPDARFTANVNCVSISGNIYHDANGLVNDTVDANGSTGQFAANGAYAVLTNASTNAVIATVPIAAGGAYSFGRADAGVYNIFVSNTATPGTTVTASTYPAGGYVSTGEKLGNTNGNDGLVDGKLTITLGTVPVTNANFGLQIPPVTADSTLAAQANPGGFNYYTIPSGAFRASDADGTLDSLIVTSFPSGANYLRAGAVIYTNGGTCPPQSTCTAWPGTLRLPYSAAATLSVDPTSTGNTSVVLSYTVKDNANASSNNGVSSAITIPFTVPATPIVITGNVWNDANGNGTKEATEALTSAASAGQTLYAILVQTTNTYSGAATVYTSMAVTAADTGYMFSNVPSGNGYEVRIASLAAQPAAGAAWSTITPALATNYIGVSTSNSGVITANQQTANLVNSLGTVSKSVTNVNFGIERKATADNKSFIAPSSAFAMSSTVLIGGQPSYAINGNNTQMSGSATRSLSGSDPEDCATASSCSAGKTYIIRTVNSNTRLFYNFGGTTGTVEVTASANNTIANFDPAKLNIYGQQGQGNSDANALGFTYSLIDAAGVASAPATYALKTNSTALPLNLVSFEAAASGCKADLKWSTLNEQNCADFIVEQSNDGETFYEVNRIKVQNNAAGATYQTTVSDLNGQHFFRLKITDISGSFTYSQVLRVSNQCDATNISVYPNPVSDKLTVSGVPAGSTVRLFNATGALVQAASATTATVTVSTLNLQPGLYYLDVKAQDGTALKTQKIVKQ